MADILKKYETIGCCGLDCGLCPGFYTKGDSVCPGCGGLNFHEKHPSCGFLTCCAIKKDLEVCSDCPDYPCKKFDAERQGHDSFVSHRKIFFNHDLIKEKGIDSFLDQQKIRMNILKDFLSNYDDGRSKSFYCLGCALLPLDELQKIHGFAQNLDQGLSLKEKSRSVVNYTKEIAESMNIELKLKRNRGTLK